MKEKLFKLISLLSILILIIIIGFFITKRIENHKIERTPKQLSYPELKIEDLSLGKGKYAKEGDTVSVHYIGKLEDGTVFDNSYQKNRPLTFTIGKGRLIPGWEIGIEGMKVGGKRRLIIPPELGYGESGIRDMIPPNSTIIFEIELLEIKEN